MLKVYCDDCIHDSNTDDLCNIVIGKEETHQNNHPIYLLKKKGNANLDCKYHKKASSIRIWLRDRFCIKGAF